MYFPEDDSFQNNLRWDKALQQESYPVSQILKSAEFHFGHKIDSIFDLFREHDL